MPYCGETSFVKIEPTSRTARAIKCRSWSCPDCGPQRKRQLQAQGHAGAPTLFLTLTSIRDDKRTPEGAAYELARAWRLLRLRIMRHRKWRRLPFLCVFEKTLLGWPHLHVMLRSAFIDASWISEQMRELTGAYIIKLQWIDNPGRVAGYVAKYCGKGSEKFGTCKRYWQSQDYDLRPDTQDLKQQKKTKRGERDPWSVHRLAKAWRELEWRVTWLTVDYIKAEYG